MCKPFVYLTYLKSSLAIVVLYLLIGSPEQENPCTALLKDNRELCVFTYRSITCHCPSFYCMQQHTHMQTNTNDDSQTQILDRHSNHLHMWFFGALMDVVLQLLIVLSIRHGQFKKYKSCLTNCFTSTVCISKNSFLNVRSDKVHLKLTPRLLTSAGINGRISDGPKKIVCLQNLFSNITCYWKRKTKKSTSHHGGKMNYFKFTRKNFEQFGHGFRKSNIKRNIIICVLCSMTVVARGSITSNLFDHF